MFAAAYLAFGYSWNDFCDFPSDIRAGKSKGGSAGVSLRLAVAAAVVVSLCFAVLHDFHILSWVSLGFCILLGVQYSARPLRLKERGLAGMVAAALAQRCAPAFTAAVVLAVPGRLFLPWLSWMFLWGMRGMTIHQVTDRASDLRSGTVTWATRLATLEPARYLLIAVVPLEVLTLTWSLMPVWHLPAGRTLLLAGVFFWLCITGFVIHSKRIKRETISWFRFDYVPLADLYGLALPLCFAFLLLKSFSWAAAPWVIATIYLCWPLAGQLRDHLSVEEHWEQFHPSPDSREVTIHERAC
jgi:hypothetical protein